MINTSGWGLFKPWVSIPNILLALAAIFVVALFKLTSSELASWVQAVGSIVAIIAAFSISQFQYRAEMLRRAQEAHDRSVGFATRLLLISREFDEVVTKAIDRTFTVGTKERDTQFSWVLEELLNRLNSSMFDDLDEARNIHCGLLRKQIVGLLFTLRFSTKNSLIEERDEEVQRYQSLSPVTVRAAEILLESARNAQLR
jgi:hypothetical protein